MDGGHLVALVVAVAFIVTCLVLAWVLHRSK